MGLAASRPRRLGFQSVARRANQCCQLAFIFGLMSSINLRTFAMRVPESSMSKRPRGPFKGPRFCFCFGLHDVSTETQHDTLDKEATAQAAANLGQGTRTKLATQRQSHTKRRKRQRRHATSAARTTGGSQATIRYAARPGFTNSRIQAASAKVTMQK